MHLTPYQAVMLWDQLTRAYHGVNSFGGHTAEIYIFTCMEHSPSFQIAPNGDMAKESRTRSCHAIHELCMLFQEYYECTITVEGGDMDQLLEGTFDHRIHVTVKPNRERTKREPNVSSM